MGVWAKGREYAMLTLASRVKAKVQVVTQDSDIEIILFVKMNVFAPFHCGKLVVVTFVVDWERPLMVFMIMTRWRWRS
eukprot:10879539-Ditylum_brightwellii.AAC.1